MDKAKMFDLLKCYVSGALSVELTSEFGQNYQKGIKMVDDYIKTLEKEFAEKKGA